MQQYLTVKQTGLHEMIIQKSRFIGHVTRAETEAEALQFIQSIQKKYYDATHNCYAYMIGDRDQHQKANDDGEPGGTAGIPMLEVLKRMQLKNTVIVITRYFGGVKLGAGGLIRAYSSVTSETIKHVGIVKGTLTKGFLITIPYPLLGKLENHLNEKGHIIDHIEYLDTVKITVYVPTDYIELFQKEIINVTNDQLDIEPLNEKFVEKDVPIE